MKQRKDCKKDQKDYKKDCKEDLKDRKKDQKDCMEDSKDRKKDQKDSKIKPVFCRALTYSITQETTPSACSNASKTKWGSSMEYK